MNVKITKLKWYQDALALTPLGSAYHLIVNGSGDQQLLTLWFYPAWPSEAMRRPLKFKLNNHGDREELKRFASFHHEQKIKRCLEKEL